MPLFDMIIACKGIDKPVPILVILKSKRENKPLNSFAFLLVSNRMVYGEILLNGDEAIDVLVPENSPKVSVKLRKIGPIRKFRRSLTKKRNLSPVISGRTQQLIIPLKDNKYEKGPKFSIIIPNKDNFSLLKNAIDGLFFAPCYQNIELIIVDNNSKDNDLLEYYDKLRENEKIKIIKFNEAFNFSRANNIGRKSADGEILIFANNDLQVIDPNFIDILIRNFKENSRAIYGAKLLYSNNAIQHAGIGLGIGGLCGHYGRGLNYLDADWFELFNKKREVSAITGAFMAIDAGVFDALNGFDENYVIEFSDIDICLRASKLSIKTIFDPELIFYHFEGSTRKIAESIDPVIIQDRIRFFEKWSQSLVNDKFLPPNISRENEIIGFEK